MSEVVAKSQLEHLDQDDYRKLVDQLVQMVVLSDCEDADTSDRGYKTFSFGRNGDLRVWSLKYGETGRIRVNIGFSGATVIPAIMEIFNNSLPAGVPHINVRPEFVLIDFQYDREVVDGEIVPSKGSFVINDRHSILPGSNEHLMDYATAMVSAISEYVGSLIAKEASKISGETRVAVRAASEL